jgi:hypothetical protein
MSTIRNLAEDALEQAAEIRDELAELVRSGGYPYIKITLVEPETGLIEIEHHGLAEDVDLAAAFQQIGLLIAEQEEA